MATISTLQRTTLTPAVVKLLTEPLPATLPPPPAGYNYEVVPTAAGGAERTGKLISTDRTVFGPLDLADNPALQQFVQFGAAVAAVAVPEILAGAPTLAQKAAPLVLDKIKGGTLWDSGMTSSPALRAFLIQQARQRLISSALTARLRLPLTTPSSGTSGLNLSALARLPLGLRAPAFRPTINPQWPPLVLRLLGLRGQVV